MYQNFYVLNLIIVFTSIDDKLSAAFVVAFIYFSKTK